MRVHARSWLMALVCGVLLAAILPAVAQGFGIKEFVAVNCKEAFPECASTGAPFFFPKAPNETEAKTQGFLEAGGRVPFGVTTFKVETEGNPGHEFPAGTVAGGEIVNPAGLPVHIRTDVAPGLATNPFAPEQCTMAKFDHAEVAAGKFLEPECGEGSEIGINHVVAFVPQKAGGGAEGADVPLVGTVYNLEPGEGKWASRFGVAVSLEPLGFPGVFVHTIINGNVEWGKQARGTNAGDFHDYFEIEVSPELPLVASRLSFFGNVGEEGNKGEGDFITNATRCGNQANLITRLAMTDLGGETVTKNYIPPEHVELEGCGALEFPVEFGFSPATSVTEQPNEFTATASEQHEPEETDVSQVKSASFTLPEGMTLSPSAAKGLTACTEAQAHQEGTVFGEAFGVECAATSKIGTVNLDVPTLPPGSLKGDVYLGAPNTGTITAPPYKIYVVANNANLGLSVRLLGETFPDEVTGRVTTFFKNPPEQPFSSLTLKFERGVLAPIANPLLCGTSGGTANFEPTSAPGTTHNDAFGLTITGCASTPPPFNPAQSTANSNGNGGASTNFTFNLGRNDGEQYVGSMKTTLPPGLVGKIPAVTERCSATAAESETVACPAASQIGTATVLAGSGPTPFAFSGPVYLTSSIKGAPYGLSIKVPAIAGPFNLGTVVTAATINVDPTTAQVIVESTLPKIRGGIPLRIRNISVAVNKSGFMINPTNCAKLETVSTVGGFATLGAGGATATKALSSPFQVANCNALKFTPKFKASSSAKTSRVNGASLSTTITYVAGQANIKSVKVQLPRQLPSRLTTLQKACVAQVFAVNPAKCPSGAFVGGATVKTPTLPSPLKGAAILVSHAGASFPDLDLVLEEQTSHLKVILVGNTNIKNGITTTTFASTPDVPIQSATVSLPIGAHSALAAFGGLCAKPLVMPTTLTAQNGKTVKQNTIISVAGCGVRIVGHKVVGNTAIITVQTFAAGRISGGGPGLKTVYKRLNKAFKKVSIKVPLSAAGRSKHKPLHIKLRVGFVPKAKHGARSASSTKVTFR